MNRGLHSWLIILVLLCVTLLYGCGGGGGTNIISTAQATEKIVAATLSAGTVPKPTVIVGERNVTLGTVTIKWDTSHFEAIQSMVFSVRSTTDFLGLIDVKHITLADATGDLRLKLVNYIVFVSDDTITLVFPDGFRMPTGDIPVEYKLRSHILSDATPMKDISVNLVSVEMRNQDVTALVAGTTQSIRIISMVGMNVPSMKSESLSQYDNLSPDAIVSSLIEISCPPQNGYGCILMSMDLETNGLLLNNVFSTTLGNHITMYPGLRIEGGQTLLYTVYVRPAQNTLTAKVVNMSFDVGGVQVSPIISSTCNSFVPNVNCS